MAIQAVRPAIHHREPAQLICAHGRSACHGRAASSSEKTARPDVVSWLRDEVKRRVTRLTLDEMYYDSMKARPTRNPPSAPSTRLERDLDYDLIGLSAPTMLMGLQPRALVPNNSKRSLVARAR